MVTNQYFDEVAERQRLLVHDYQQTEIRKLSSMKITKLLDSHEIPLKSFADVATALMHTLDNGLSTALAKFFVLFVGHWPTQYYMRQSAYSSKIILRDQIHFHSLIGHLHISWNSKETIFLTFHTIFKDLYLFLFGMEKLFLHRNESLGTSRCC